MRDVLILGGGLAGAATALGRSDRGIGATIIGARSRLGGRAMSRQIPGDDRPVVEHDGGWAHGNQPKVQTLAARSGIARHMGGPTRCGRGAFCARNLGSDGLCGRCRG